MTSIAQGLPSGPPREAEKWMLMGGGAVSAEFHFHPLSINLTGIWLRNPFQKHLGFLVARPLPLGIQPLRCQLRAQGKKEVLGEAGFPEEVLDCDASKHEKRK